MEEIMKGIYNYLFDAEKELGIKDIKIYQNLERNWIVSYKKIKQHILLIRLIYKEA